VPPTTVPETPVTTIPEIQTDIPEEPTSALAVGLAVLAMLAVLTTAALYGTRKL
jgi:hypothetical protein